MTQNEIIEMARQANFYHSEYAESYAASIKDIEAFAKLVAEKEREVVANWIMDRGFATGHGDSIVDLLDQLEWQIAEKEREACAKIADEWVAAYPHPSRTIAEWIRKRGQA